MAVAGLIVGLGNPGKQYESTRHNMGFMFVDELLREARNVSSMSGDKFRCELWKATLPGSSDQWLIAKPQTFMNLSGECVQPLAAWHRLLPENILVVHDELDIAPGTTVSSPLRSVSGRRISTACGSASGVPRTAVRIR